jgi:4-hydroxy-tetrahydrodipicolinate synthase
VLFTFFDDEGRIREDGFEHQVAHCLSAGTPGVVLFGFVTQFYKLTLDEKLQILKRTATAIGGKASLGVTVMGPTLEAQLTLCKAAENVSADWLIIQPPIGPPVSADWWLETIGYLAERTNLPVAVQNAAIAGTTLSIEQLLRLQDRHPNVLLCKAENGLIEVARFAREYGERFRVMTGNWGAEYPYFAANGAHGFIPAPIFVHELVKLANLLNGSPEEVRDAMRLYSRLLTFIQLIREVGGVEHQLLAGKRIYEWQTDYDTGGTRVPGPSKLDPSFELFMEKELERMA